MRTTLGRAVGGSPATLGEPRRTGAYFAGSDHVGGGLRKLAGAEIQVTQKGFDLVKTHLSQFGDYGPNSAMLDRLRGAMVSAKPATGADASFYMHEATEATKIARGMTYDEAHAAALEKHGVSPYSVYAPEVISDFGSHFNQNWRSFWGMD